MIFLDAETARQILNALNSGVTEIEISTDLGISQSSLILSEFNWDVDGLEKISKDPKTIYFIREDGIFKAAIDGPHFYKLHPSGRGFAPALLIDGVLMHRVKSVDPITDAKSKAALCARKGFTMLEICTGLGYSTISCLDRDIRSIVTIEKDKDVLELASINPWSKRLFSDSRVKLVEGDAVEIIAGLDSSIFDAVLHDPPRFTMASELYTSEFYREIYRVLKRKGILFHYVGSPGSKHRKRDLPKGVMNRLREIGFIQVKRNKDALGVVARHP